MLEVSIKFQAKGWCLVTLRLASAASTDSAGWAAEPGAGEIATVLRADVAVVAVAEGVVPLLTVAGVDQVVGCFAQAKASPALRLSKAPCKNFIAYFIIQSS